MIKVRDRVRVHNNISPIDPPVSPEELIPSVRVRVRIRIGLGLGIGLGL
jgi:hypothetical protein